MAYSKDDIRASEARKLCVDWFQAKKAGTGMTHDELARTMNAGLNAGSSASLSRTASINWFSPGASQASLVPPYRAMEFKAKFNDFPLEAYLKAYYTFLIEHTGRDESGNISDQRVEGGVTTLLLYQDVIEDGYAMRERHDLLQLVNDIESQYQMRIGHLPESAKASIRAALVEAMDGELAAIAGNQVAPEAMQSAKARGMRAVASSVERKSRKRRERLV